MNKLKNAQNFTKLHYSLKSFNAILGPSQSGSLFAVQNLVCLFNTKLIRFVRCNIFIVFIKRNRL
jgi:hypothetical protein